MFAKRNSIEQVTKMGCCGCFGFSFFKSPKKMLKPSKAASRNTCEEFLLNDDPEDEQDSSFQNDNMIGSGNANGTDIRSPAKQSKDILMHIIQNGLICREFPVKETHSVLRSEVIHKSHLSKKRVSSTETGLSDVLREVLIMKVLSHPNIVNIVEVIDDPTDDHLYMVLEYLEGKWVFDDAGSPSSLGEETARKYLHDLISGLMYLHAHNIVHGDIKPDNLLISGSGRVKIGDFGISHIFEDDNDKRRRSPGTPLFTAPECCLGLTYHGKAADTWAVGVTLYCMVLGKYPFIGDTLPDIYDKIVNNPLFLPDEMNPLLKNLLEGLLCKDPRKRMTLHDVARHAWVIGESGSIPQHLCWCKSKKLQKEASNGS